MKHNLQFDGIAVKYYFWRTGTGGAIKNLFSLAEKPLLTNTKA